MAGEDDSLGIEIGADASGAVAAFDALSASVDKFGGSMTSASGSFATMEDAANSTIVPTRAAHQALALVGSDIATMSGAGAAATGPMHLLESTLFAVAMGGAAVSPIFIGISVALAAASYAVKAFSADSAAATAGMKSYASSMESAILSADKLTDSQRQYAGVLAAQLQPQIIQARADLQNYQAQLDQVTRNFKAASSGNLTWAQTLRATIPFYGNTADATNGLAASQVDLEGKIRTAVGAVATLNEKLAALTGASAGSTDATRKAAEALAELDKAAENKALADAVELLHKDEDAADKAGKAFSRFSEAAVTKTAEINEATLGLADKLDVIPAKYAKMALEANKYFDNEAARIQASAATTDQKNSEMVQLSQQRNSQLVAIDNQKTQALINNTNKWFGVTTTAANQASSIMSSSFQSAASGVGSAFAKMIVEGQNFGKAIKALSISVAEKVIEDFVTMGIEWGVMNATRVVVQSAADAGIIGESTAAALAQKAITGAYATDAVFAYEAVALAAAAAFGAIGGPPGSKAAVVAEKAIFAPIEGLAIASAATGADFITDQPTRLLVGEGGQAERVQVTPLSSGGSSSSSTGANGDTYNFTFGNIILQGVQNPRELADKLSLLIMQSIRGRGQISAVGKSIH